MEAAPLKQIVERHDEAVAGYLKRQITDPSNPDRGSYPDAYGIVSAQAASGLVNAFTAAFIHPQSRYHKDAEIVSRLRLAAGFLNRAQNEHGNIDLRVTNFNSPPDTGFVVHNVAPAAFLGKRYHVPEVTAALEPFLRKAGRALSVGGVHTPNHRWVICQALAEINSVFPDSSYLRRIDQWLAEGIDIDSDGQFDERSTTIYNTVVDRALTVVAAKLNRPELLEPVRLNLNAMMYLLHPGYEVVTEISHRQDQYQRGDMGRYWFPLRYLAVHDGNGQYATLADYFAPRAAGLAALLEYPELAAGGPPPEPIPEDYEKVFPGMAVARIRRGPVSATLLLQNDSRFLTLRRGHAIIEAVRFASAFFGKGQFVSRMYSKENGGYLLSQELEGPYYQPFDPPRRIAAGEWSNTRPSRKQSDICKLRQTAFISETKTGFRVRLRSDGTSGVPLAVEIGFRSGASLQGARELEGVADGWLMGAGAVALSVGKDIIRIGPGAPPAHTYTQVRGAQPKLPGSSLYITGYTPFDKTIDFDLA